MQGCDVAVGASAAPVAAAVLGPAAEESYMSTEAASTLGPTSASAELCLPENVHCLAQITP